MADTAYPVSTGANSTFIPPSPDVQAQIAQNAQYSSVPASYRNVAAAGVGKWKAENQQYGPNLVNYVIRAESNGGQNTKDSPAGAKGPFQVMDATARGLGYDPANDRDPVQSTQMGTQLLGQLLDRFKDPRKALAAYNSSPNHVNQAVAQYGDNWLEGMPSETQKYVNGYDGQYAGAQSPAMVKPSNAALQNIVSTAIQNSHGADYKNTPVTQPTAAHAITNNMQSSGMQSSGGEIDDDNNGDDTNPQSLSNKLFDHSSIAPDDPLISLIKRSSSPIANMASAIF